MRPMLVVSTGVTLLLLASGAGWAGGSSGDKKKAAETSQQGKDKEPASFNKTFQWEEKVVGPKTKGVDHDRIAAMQAQGRREDAERRKEPPKKPTRSAGVNGPASSVIPTQDIEKPAPAGSVHLRKAAYTPPKQHDDLDNLLAENGVGSGSDESRDGLGKVFGTKSHKSAKHARHARRRR